MGPDCIGWFGREGQESGSAIVMMHTDISRAYFHAPCKEGKYVELPHEMWSNGCPEYGRLRVSLYGTRDAANWEGAYAKALREHQFDRGVACPCSFYERKESGLLYAQMTSNHADPGTS